MLGHVLPPLLSLQAAYVRQRVLQTWAKLVEESCVPLNHWNILLQQGEAPHRLGGTFARLLGSWPLRVLGARRPAGGLEVMSLVQ